MRTRRLSTLILAILIIATSFPLPAYSAVLNNVDYKSSIIEDGVYLFDFSNRTEIKLSSGQVQVFGYSFPFTVPFTGSGATGVYSSNDGINYGIEFSGSSPISSGSYKKMGILGISLEGYLIVGIQEKDTMTWGDIINVPVTAKVGGNAQTEIQVSDNPIGAAITFCVVSNSDNVSIEPEENKLSIKIQEGAKLASLGSGRKILELGSGVSLESSWDILTTLKSENFPVAEFSKIYELDTKSFSSDDISFYGTEDGTGNEIPIKGLTNYVQAMRIKDNEASVTSFGTKWKDVFTNPKVNSEEGFLKAYGEMINTAILNKEPIDISGLSTKFSPLLSENKWTSKVGSETYSVEEIVTEVATNLNTLIEKGILPLSVSGDIKSVKFGDGTPVSLDFRMSDFNSFMVTTLNENLRAGNLIEALKDKTQTKTKRALYSLSYLTMDTLLPDAMAAISTFYNEELSAEISAVFVVDLLTVESMKRVAKAVGDAFKDPLGAARNLVTNVSTSKSDAQQMAKQIYVWLNSQEGNTEYSALKSEISSTAVGELLTLLSEEAWQDLVLSYSTAAMDLRSHSPDFDFIADVEFLDKQAEGVLTSTETFNNLVQKIPSVAGISEGSDYTATDKQYFDTLALRMQLFYHLAKASPDIDSASYQGLDALMSMSNNPKPDKTDVSPYHSVYIGNIYNYEGYLALLNTINEMHSARMEFIKLYAGVPAAEVGKEEEARDALKTQSIEAFNSFGKFSAMNEAQLLLRGMTASAEEYSETLNSWYLTPAEIVTDLWHTKLSNGTGTDKSLAELWEIMLTYNIDLSALDEYDSDQPDNPFRLIFGKDKTGDFYSLCSSLNRGIAQSATFVPLKTNVYDPYTYLDVDNDEFFDFHDRWGYFRKALYVDANHRAATDLYTTGRRGANKVITLKDFLEANDEVVLYSDPNFYNAKQLAEIRNLAWGKVDNGVDAESQNSANPLALLWENFVDVFTTDVYEVLKTAGKEQYTTSLNGVKSYKDSSLEGNNPKLAEKREKEFNNANSKEGSVMPALLIDHYIGNNLTDTTPLDSYSIMTPFAVVSGLYRYKELIDDLYRNNPNREPVFIASQDLAAQVYTSAEAGTKVHPKYANAIINWALLKNIDSQKTMSYETSLDMNNPLYLDIYGNILTESGLVVIPSAANATFQKQYVALNTAFLYSYGKSYEIPKSVPIRQNIDKASVGTGAELISVLPSPLFTLDNESKTWTLNELTNSDIVDMDAIAIADRNALSQLRSTWVSYLIANGKDDVWDYKLFIKESLLEVMRGAPIEFIDKDQEGINTYTRLSVSGIKNAVKLDNFLKSVKGKVGNHLMSLPNPAFVEGLEYVILFVYKTLILGIAFIVIIQIFAMALRNASLKDMGVNVIMSFLLLLILMYVIPKTFELTYYQVNRFVLQDEMMELLLYTTEKEAQGVEVGMIDVKAPAKTSSLLVKIKDVDVPWSRLFIDILREPIQSNLTNIYSQYLENDTTAGFEEFQVKGDAIYMDLRDLVNSSRIDVNVEYNFMMHYANEIVPASHYTPYYYFIDRILLGLTDYNNGVNSQEKNYASYTTSVYKGGRIISRGFPEAYYNSKEFLEFTENSQDLRDLLGLRSLYEMVGIMYDSVSGEEIENEYSKLHSYQWYNERLSEHEIELRITKLEKHYVDYIKKNRHLIGAVSDETFLKMTALEMALQYNRLFSINSFNTIELYELAMEDLIRIGTAKPEIVMEGSPYDFVRYLYSVSDSGGIVVACALMLLLMMLNVLKPLFVFAVYLLIYVSMFWHKLILQRENHSMQGYLMLTGLLCTLNIVNALIMKIAFYLPWLHFAPIVCMLILFAINLVFLMAYLLIIGKAIANWRDVGAQAFAPIYQSVSNFVLRKGDSTASLMQNVNAKAENSSKEEKQDSGWNYLQEMKNKDEGRERSSNDNPWK